MKIEIHIYRTIKIFAWILSMSAAMMFNLPTAYAQNYDPRRTIAVFGSAEIKAEPNEVIISMSVETNSMSIDKAQSDNDAKVSAVLTMARSEGVEAQDLQTDYLRIEPRDQERTNDRGETTNHIFLGYFVTKRITIVLKDISKFERILSNAVKLGTNYVSEIEFKTTEIRKYRDQARLEAIRAAREKATALASELGQKIGKPITIRELSLNERMGFEGNVMPPPPEYDEHIVHRNSSVAPGELKITDAVAVMFELE